MKEKKKIGLTGCILMGIGCIVGSGIFGSLPEIISTTGGGIVYALILAAIVIILRSITRMYTIAALPTSASTFMHATKLMHPYVGALISVNAFLQPTMVALFGVLFATYFQELFPGCPLSSTTVSVCLLAAFAVLAWFGNKSTISVGNIIVIILLAAIAVYIVCGLPHLNPENISFMSVIKPGISVSAVSAAAGVLTSSLSGASSCAELADDVKNPGRNVPITLIVCPVLVCLTYILMAVVTLGVVPYANLESLAQVARHFLSPELMIFFIVGGPIAGIITSLIPVALACVAVFDFSSRNRIYPEVLSKKNKYGVPYWSLLIVSAISIGICATGATFGVVMTVFSLTNTIGELPNTISPIFAYKKYPKSCDNSSVRMSSKVATALSVITFLICIYLCVEMVKTLGIQEIALTAAVYLLGYVYFCVRVRYLRQKENYDLIGELKKPYERWMEREKSL